MDHDRAGIGVRPGNRNTGPRALSQVIAQTRLTNCLEKVQNSKGFGEIIHIDSYRYQCIARSNYKENNCVGGDQDAAGGITSMLSGQGPPHRQYN